MAKIYYRRIKDGVMTLDEVPERWREQVRQMLEEKSITIDQNDIKKILAKKFGVEESQIIKAQYSYIVMLDEEVPDDEE